MFDRLAGIATQFITLVAGLIALVVVSWWLGALMILAVIPGILVQFRLSRLQVNHWNENVETRRARNTLEWYIFEPKRIAEIRLYGVAKHLLKLRSKLRDADEKDRIEFERKFIFKRLGADSLEAAAEAIALIYTTMQIIAHTQPIGRFLYVQQVVSRALGGSTGFVSQVNSLDEDIANLFDYQEFMKIASAKRGTKKLVDVPQTLTVDHVSFTYPQSTQEVLHDVSLTVKKGQHVAIVGENGAGKSTLIKLIVGLYHPTKGRIMLDDQDMRELDIETWHDKLGVLQQDYLEYSFASARDNVYYGDVNKPFDQERFNKALDRAEATTFIKKLPKAEESFVSVWMEHNDGTKGVDLSGGQWQRLALARNFYRNSPVIVLDEPTSAIDALAESRIFRHLFADSRTIITISHRLTTVEKADVIFVLQDGRIVEHGTHTELVAKQGAYFTIFENQLR